jgi:hypothetical protein
VPHKPSLLYKFNEEKYQELTQTGFDNFGFWATSLLSQL